MSLRPFDAQAALFSTAALSAPMFAPTDRYRIFQEKIYPRLVHARQTLAGSYCQDNGRPGVEPVLLAGVTLLQFLEGVPDRQAAEMLRYHAGWNFALSRQLGDPVFHATVLTYFRDRLIEHQHSALIFAQVLEGLVETGLVRRRCKQRLDATQVTGLLRHMSRLECVRETLRLALNELEETAPPFGRPAFWDELWERYVPSQLDYRTLSKTG